MPALALVALLALGLAACGGGGDASSSRSAAIGPSQGTTTSPSGQSGDNRGTNEKQPGDDNGSRDGDGGPGDGNRGESSAAFRTPGGDNSIQDFGEEAARDEREAAERAIVAYLNARAKAEWAKSCTYLSKGALKPLEEFSGSSPELKRRGCGAVIEVLYSEQPASLRRSPVIEGIASLRAEGDRGFALFHGPKGNDYFIGVVKEGGEWKVASLTASELP